MKKNLVSHKHAILPINPKAAVDNLIADLTVGLRDEYALTQCGTVLKETPIEKIPHNTRSVMKSIQTKIIAEDLCICKADKGNTVVVMNRNEYNTKMMEFIESNKGVKVNFSITAFNKKVRKCIDNSTYLLDDREKYFVKIMNPLGYTVHRNFINITFPYDP